MATTGTNLYRSVMDKKFKKIDFGVYPGDGVLDPRWESTQYMRKGESKPRISQADVDVVPGKDGPEVKEGGGTSLHDVPGWFPCKEFVIPAGTEYDDGVIFIRKDKHQKTCSGNPNLKGYHYQLEPKQQMTVLTFKGALDNMARAAVVKQVALAKGTV